jgi:hypothetical protein
MGPQPGRDDRQGGQEGDLRNKGHKVAASEDNPEYIVESAKTGARAAHRPSELKKA